MALPALVTGAWSRGDWTDWGSHSYVLTGCLFCLGLRSFLLFLIIDLILKSFKPLGN